MDSCSATAEPSDRCGWNEVGQSSGAHTFAPTRTRTDNNDDDDVGNARRTMPSKTESGGGGNSGRAGTKPLDQHAAANGPRTVGVSAHTV